MKICVAFNLFLLLSVTHTATATLLRSSSVAETTTIDIASTRDDGNEASLVQSSSFQRDLQNSVDDFVPLGCNSQINSASCATTWSSLFGSGSEKSERITIPCGQCVTMDHAGDTLTLVRGLDIQGKLVFPDNYSLHIIAPMIVVQGVLKMTATKPVNGAPSITFTMTGQTANTFAPIGENSNACGGDCNVGKKSITVAGGKVDSK